MLVFYRLMAWMETAAFVIDYIFAVGKRKKMKHKLPLELSRE